MSAGHRTWPAAGLNLLTPRGVFVSLLRYAEDILDAYLDAIDAIDADSVEEHKVRFTFSPMSAWCLFLQRAH